MFKVEITGLTALQEILHPQTIRSATTSTLNKLMGQVKTAAVKNVTARWNIKRNELTTTGTGKARLQIKRARWNNQTVTLDITGRPISLSYFGAIHLRGEVATRYGATGKKGISKQMIKKIISAQNKGQGGVIAQ